MKSHIEWRPMRREKQADAADVKRVVTGLNEMSWESADPIGEGKKLRASSPGGDHTSALVFHDVSAHGSVVCGAWWRMATSDAPMPLNMLSAEDNPSTSTTLTRVLFYEKGTNLKIINLPGYGIVINIGVAV